MQARRMDQGEWALEQNKEESVTEEKRYCRGCGREISKRNKSGLCKVCVKYARFSGQKCTICKTNPIAKTNVSGICQECRKMRHVKAMTAKRKLLYNKKHYGSLRQERKRERLALDPNRKIYTFVCRYCGRPFKTNNMGERYCCPEHRREHWSDELFGGAFKAINGFLRG